MTDENEILAGLDAQFSEEDGAEHSILTSEMFQRRLVWDVVPCEMAEDVIKALGLPPVSEDVEQTEHVMAHERLAALGTLNLLVNAMSNHVSHIQIQAVKSTNESVTDENLQAIAMSLYPMISSAAKAVVAELLDLGLLHTPHTLVPIVEILNLGEPRE